jgi:O-antigen ligase
VLLAFDRHWTTVLVLCLALILVCGGISVPSLTVLTVLVATGVVVLALGTARAFEAVLTGFTKWSFILILIGVGLIVLQTVPLPSYIWTTFAGREFVVDSFGAAGIQLGWLPLSLDPQATKYDLMFIAPALALFIAALSIKTDQRVYLILTLLGVVFVNIILGLAQKFQGPTSSLYVYDFGFNGSATGFFANRNFLAALLYCAIPFVVALALNWVRSGKTHKMVGPFFAFIFIAIIISGLGATESRMGIILAFIAILFSIPLIWTKHGQSIGSRGLIIIIFVAIFLIAQFGLVSILRLASTDSVSEYRTTIFAISYSTLRSVFPVGAGFGSFVPLYAMHETPSAVTNVFVNHAHNDWLELVIEGGLPMAILLVAYVAWYASATYNIWARGRDISEDLFVKAASISIGLLLCHSFFDYPLRTPALMGLFAMLNGFLACGPQPISPKLQKRKSPHRVSAEPERAIPSGEFKSNFKNKKKTTKIDN